MNKRTVSQLLITALFLLGINFTHAATVTWDASGTSPATPTDGSGNWGDTATNWSNGSISNGWVNGDSAIIGNTNGAAGNITITNAAGVTVSNITINSAGSGSYTIASSAGTLNLTGSPTITVSNTVSATISAIMTGTGFTKAGSGMLLLNQGGNNTNTGDVVVNAGMLQPGSTGGRLYISGNLIVNTNGTFTAVSGTPGSGVFGNGVLVLNGAHPNGSNVFVNSGAWISAGTCVLANGAVITNLSGATQGTYAVTNTDARSGAVWLTRHGFGIFNNIYKSTAGTVIMATRPNSSGTDGYIATVNAGSLVFDIAYANQNANRLKANSPLNMGGGTLVLSNYSTLNPSANNPGSGGTFFNPGASTFYATNGGASGGGMTLGTITRKVGGTINVKRSTTDGLGGTFGSAGTPNVNGIVGGYATFNLTDWTAGTTTWTNLVVGFYQTNADSTLWTAITNVSLSLNPSANLDDVTINTLRLTAASTVTINPSKTLTISSGGLLVTGSGATTITGGSLKGAANTSDLIVHQNASADLTIASDLADNTTTSLTKDGSGKLIITGANNLTGTNYLNGGAVEVSDLAKLASGPLDMNNGTLRYTGADATSSRAVVTRGMGPTFDIISGTKVTQTGAIKGSGDAFGDLGGITKIGAGTLILTASNNFNGETVVSNGVLAINGTNNYTTTLWDAGKVTVYGGTLGGTGQVSGPVTVKNGGTISPGNSIGTLTLATNLILEAGSTNLFEVTNGAAGDLLAIQGNLTIGANCTIAISVLGAALDSTTNTIITYTGTKSGSFNSAVVLAGGSLNSSLSVDESTPGQIKLVAVPQLAIASQPQGTNTIVGTSFSVSVVAYGQSPVTYQWYLTDTNLVATNAITDATNSTYSVPVSASTDSGYYRVVITNDFNSVTSTAALVLIGNQAPTLSGPANQTVIAGNNATLTATLTAGAPAPSYQWYFGGSPLADGSHIAGSTSLSLTISNTVYPGDQGTYSIVASNVAGATTNSAVLTVIVPPVITPQPTNITVNVGGSATFTSGATGVPTPALQWRKNGVNILNETNATLTISSAAGSDVATYSLRATNTAGTATSSNATLEVDSTTLAATAFSPTNGATGVCYDTPLYVTFNAAVSVANSGKIRVFNAADATLVDSIDMSSNVVIISGNTGKTNNVQVRPLFSGDSTQQKYYPVITAGSVAAIYLHLNVLTSNKTYYVTLDSGVVKDTAGAYFSGISDTNTWRFTTKPTGPADTNNIVVNADGSADFVTVQGAVESIPPGNTVHRLIYIRNGDYNEEVNISGKNNVTFRGESRTGVVVGNENCDNINPGTHGRMSFKIGGNDIAVENMTVTNRTLVGGSQAEAFMIESAATRFICNNATVASYQDTILANQNNSAGFFYNSLIQGQFDYIWGGGRLFFTNCEIRTLLGFNGATNTGQLTASRTDLSGTNGLGFYRCTFTRATNTIVNTSVAGGNGAANGNAAFISSFFDDNYTNATAAALAQPQILWEFGNSNLNGTLPRTFGLTVLTPPDGRLTAAQTASIWLGGWTPSLLPNFLTQPVSTNVNPGQPASFTASATGVPDPTYQWQKDGTNLPGATSATLSIASTVVADVGSYAVIATTTAGSVTSSVVALTVNCPTITISPATLPPNNVGAAYSQTVTASGGNVPITFTNNSGTLPTGLSFTSGGLLSGTLSNSGSFSFTVIATDAFGCSTTTNYTINVTCPTITISPVTLPNGNVGAAYSQTVTASGGNAPYTFTNDSGTLPTGLSFTSGGLLSGTLSNSGSFNFTVTVTDAFGCTATTNYTIGVTCPTITVAPATLPSGFVNVAYNQTNTASGGNTPYTFTVDTGTLPAGITLNTGTGVISGTPTNSGSSSFCIKATDAFGCYSTNCYVLSLNCPTIVLTGATNGFKNVNYTNAVFASNGFAPYTVAFGTGTLPPGLSFNASTGISGKPTTYGSYSFTLSAVDSAGCSNNQAYTILIVSSTPDTNAPSITIKAPANNGFVSTASLVVTGSVSDNVLTTNVQVSLDGGAYANATLYSNVTWSLNLGAPSSATHTVAVKGTDSSGNTGTGTGIKTNTFYYGVYQPLTIYTNGQGSVKPFANSTFGTSSNGAQLVVGKVYKIQAVMSNTNYLFSNIVDSVLGPTNASTYIFTMSTGLTLTVNFETNLFFDSAGSYNGLFMSGGITLSNAGLISGKVTAAPNKSATFSGSVYVDGYKWPTKKMTFGLDGTATSGEILRSTALAGGTNALVVRLTLPLPGDDTLSGTVSNTDGSWVSPIVADRAVFGAANPATNYAGRYTMAMPGVTNDFAVQPGGYGYGLLTIDTNGVIKLAGGKLADGLNFKQTVAVGKNGDWPLYVVADKDSTTKRNQSTIMGWVTVASAPTNNLSGTLTWIKDPHAGDLKYPNGFSNTAAILASPYYAVAPTTNRVIELNAGTGTVVLSGAGLTNIYLKSTTLTVSNKFLFESNSLAYKVTLTAATGKLSGTFKPTDFNNATTPFYGVVMTNLNVGGGYLSPQSGTHSNETGYFFLLDL